MFTIMIIDLFKDIFYCAIVEHENHVLTYFLWIFSMFAVVFTALRILVMRKVTYKEIFGDDEFADGTAKRISFFCLKMRRVMYEVFYLHQDNSSIEGKLR